MDSCVICKGPFLEGQSPVTLREKGSRGINNASENRCDTLVTKAGQCVHEDCRREYCNGNVIKRDLNASHKLDTDASTSKPCTRQTCETRFIFSECCLFCGQRAKCSDRKKRGYNVFPVRTMDFQNAIEKICKARADSWGETVFSRVVFARDLPAVDAVYHQQCNVNFRTMKQVPKSTFESKIKCSGRPKHNIAHEAFLKVTNYLSENDDEQITVTDLVDKMVEYCGEHAYSFTYMKTKIQEYFGERIIVTEINGKQNVVTFQSTASSILHEYFKRGEQQTLEDEKITLLRTAARLIKSDIRLMASPKMHYPAPQDLSSLEYNKSFVPESLQVLLGSLFTEKDAELKVTAIGQCIVQAARPKVVIAPLQIGLAVQLHHHFASRFLIDTLHSYGFSSSYTEVKKFEMCAAVYQEPASNSGIPNQCVKFMADNVDHDVCTLDGKNTFHGMGIIASQTPWVRHENKVVPRISVTQEDVIAIGRIECHFLKGPCTGMNSLCYKKLPANNTQDNMANLDLLWKLSWPLRSPRPAWSGTMQALVKGKHPGKSATIFLPMIDMSATDMSCVYSTLIFVCKQARHYNVKPILTFDQPLWWKANLIVQNEPNNAELREIILCLGGFHTEMSFLGCVGNLMSGSGLQEVLEQVYAPNSVVHMFSGKAVARAVRGHLLVDAALNALLGEKTFGKMFGEANVPSQQSDAQVQNDDVAAALLLYDKVMAEEVPVAELCKSELLNKLTQRLNDTKKTLSNYRTASLWVQYMGMIDILRKFIRGERTGNWSLHLSSLQEMLPYFAAAGHNHYAKSVYIYIQQISELETKHPDVFRLFSSGHHVVRRSDRYWAGLSPDLAIEQILMRSVKTTGGLTRGRGMGEVQRLVWLLSMPSCVEINDALQELTGSEYHTSEQHKDCSTARQERDDKDTLCILHYLQERNPFSGSDSLRNIANGLTAESRVNVDRAQEVGHKILKNMIGKEVLTHSFKRSEQAVTLGVKNSIKADNDHIQVDLQLLFQRLMLVAKNMGDNIAEVFKYELCHNPSAMFDAAGLMREANKPVLADSLWAIVSNEMTEQPLIGAQHVIDGGSLLQRLPWQRGSSFNSICQTYINYVSKNYKHPIIVFDGYECGPSIKDTTHIRRSGGVVGVEVHFTGDMPPHSKKEQFLANKVNKQKFINMLSVKLMECGCSTIHADGDADLLIVTTAVDCAKTCETVVIGEDTDLLVLLCFHAKLGDFRIFLTSEGRQLSKKPPRVWNIQSMKAILGSDTYMHMPFIHAIGGCDSTSRLFRIGKGVPLKKLRTNGNFLKLAQTFISATSRDDIGRIGEDIVVCLYNGTTGEGLDTLRYKRFCEKASGNVSLVQVHTLPPTSAAARYHCLRVYYQVKYWSRQADGLVAEDYGWVKSIQDNRLEPVLTDMPPAPPALLSAIRCKCHSDCESRRCSCKKHGLQCSAGCSECRGTSCSNNSSPSHMDMDEEI